MDAPLDEGGREMPHYWFKVPLGTAPHLAEAKRAGAKALRVALHRDANNYPVSLIGVQFASDRSYCWADVYTDDDEAAAQPTVDALRQRWEATEVDGPLLAALEAQDIT